MSNLSHLRLENTADSLPYTSTQRGGGDFPLPRRVRAGHARRLLRELQQATDRVETLRRQQPAANEEIDGYPLTIRSDPGFALRLESLDRRRDGMELLSVRTEEDTQVANVFVRRDKLVAFVRLIEQYRDKDTKKGKPKNQPLIASIAAVQLVAVRDLWQDCDAVSFPRSNEAIWWEIWIRVADVAPETAFSHFAELARALEMRIGEHYVAFPERIVLLAWGTALQIGQSVDMLSYIAELRKAKEVPTAYLELPPPDQGAFVEAAGRRLVAPARDAPAVCLLDTGVNRQHPLIEPALAADDVQAVDPAWGLADHDPNQHGTGMAGISLYQCITEILSSSGPINLRHRLESVKLLPPPPGANDPEVYGWVTQQAVAKAEIQGPRRTRAICMAITADDRDQGLPSSWSERSIRCVQGSLTGVPS